MLLRNKILKNNQGRGRVQVCRKLNESARRRDGRSKCIFLHNLVLDIVSEGSLMSFTVSFTQSCIAKSKSDHSPSHSQRRRQDLKIHCQDCKIHRSIAAGKISSLYHVDTILGEEIELYTFV